MEFVSHWNADGVNQRGWRLGLEDQKLVLVTTPNGIGASVTVQPAWTPSANTWYHIAAVRDGNTFRVYVDGTQIGTDVDTQTVFNATSLLRIGVLSESIGLNRYMDGWIENVRITKGICRYPSGTTFTPPERAYPTVKALGTYTDAILADSPLVFFQARDPAPVGSIVNPSNVTAVDTAGFESSGIYTESQSGILSFEQTSILPNGEGQAISHSGSNWAGYFGPDRDDYTPSGSFTIEAWVRIDGSIVTSFPIWTKETSGSQFPEYQFAVLSDRTVRLYLFSQNSTTNSSLTQTTTTLTVDVSYHLVGVFRTSDNTPRIFINGSEDTTGSTWAFTVWNNTSGNNIAAINNAGGTARAAATFQEVAFYDYGLSDAQILAHYQAAGGT
jgi:hypothetical protein